MLETLKYYLLDYTFYVVTLPFVLTIGSMVYYNVRLRHRYDTLVEQAEGLRARMGVSSQRSFRPLSEGYVVTNDYIKTFEVGLIELEKAAHVEKVQLVANTYNPRAKKLQNLSHRLTKIEQKVKEKESVN